MGSSADVTIPEAKQIKSMLKSGLTYAEISKITGRCTATICNVKKGKIQTNPSKKKHHGNHNKLTNRQLRSILRRVSITPQISVRKLAKMDGIVSKSTIQRLLKKNDLKLLKQVKKPMLSKLHRQRRLEFARFHLQNSTNWHHIIFSDEKKWNLDGPDGYAQSLWVKKDISEAGYYRYRRQCGGGQ